MFRTSNPMLNNDAFAEGGAMGMTPGGATGMTLGSTIAKSGLLIGTCTAAAVGSWMLIQGAEGGGQQLMMLGLTFGGLLVGFLLTLICCFKPQAAPFTAMPVAIAEGAFAGGFSFLLTRFLPKNPETGEFANMESPEAVIFMALLLTMSIAGGLLGGYATGLIRPNKIFRGAVVAGMLGLGLFTIIAFGMSLLGGNNSLISVYDPANGGLISIGFSLFVVVLASANLMLDFETIHNGVRNRAPKYMEWYGAQTLLVTLVWIYIEVLRLLIKLANRE